MTGSKMFGKIATVEITSHDGTTEYYDFDTPSGLGQMMNAVQGHIYAGLIKEAKVIPYIDEIKDTVELFNTFAGNREKLERGSKLIRGDI